MNLIYTAGHILSKGKTIKKEAFVHYLKSAGVQTVIDIRFLSNSPSGDYAPENIKCWLAESKLNYLSRIEEGFLFNTVVKSITTYPDRSQFFRSHFFEPLLNYIQNLSNNIAPVVLLFNSWDTYTWKSINGGSSSSSQLNIKGSFCKYVYENHLELDIRHIVPNRIGGGSEIFTGYDLYELAYGYLLNIKEDIELKRKSFSDDYDQDENLSTIGDDEWNSMNEESDGAAYWNID